MSITVHGTHQPDGAVFCDLPKGISYRTEPIFTGEHAGKVALTIVSAHNEGCKGTYYGDLNFGTMKFEVVMPDTNIYVTSGAFGAAAKEANAWKFDISGENTKAWSVDKYYDTSFYVTGTESLSALAFSAGGTKEIVAGMMVYGAISGASAQVVSVTLDSGSWSAGTAAGTLYLANQIGTFVAENLRLAQTAITKFERSPGHENIVFVTSANHGLVDGNTALITDTVNFDGAYEVLKLDEDRFQITIVPPYPGDETSGNCAIYLAEIPGNSGPEAFNRIYRCILPHISTVDDAPPTGVNWKTYWKRHDYIWGYPLYSFLCRGVAVNSKGDVYVVGERVNGKTVWKFNKLGALIWSYDTGVSFLGTSGTYGVAVDSDDNVYVVGVRVGTTSVWKFSKDGVLLWTYDTGWTTNAVAVDDVGYVYIAGYRANGKNVWKLDSNNSEDPVVWSIRTGTGDPDDNRGIAVDADYNVYVAGARVDIGGGEFRTVWKFNSYGEVVWSFDTGAGSEEYIQKIAVDSIGNVFVAGNGTLLYPTEGAGHTWKLTSFGVVVWDLDIGGFNVVVDSDDVVYVAGTGAWRLNSSGGIAWTYILGDAGGVIYGIDVTNVWKSPTGHNDPDNLWQNGIAAYDKSLLSSAISSCVGGTWRGFLELLMYPPATCDKIRFYAAFEDAANPAVDVDIYYEGAWHDVYQGVFNESEWVEKTIPIGVLVSKARIRFYSSTDADIKLSEFDFRISNVYLAGNTENTISIQKLSICCNFGWGYDMYPSLVYGTVVDSRGNTYAVGSTAGGESIWKFNRCGNLTWVSSIPDAAQGIVVDGEDNIYVTGSEGGVDKVWKFDKDGVLCWTYSIGATIVGAWNASQNIAVDKAKCWVLNTAYTTTSYIIGDDKKIYHCKVGHTSTVDDCPVTGANWETYWELKPVNVYVAGAWDIARGKSVWSLDGSDGHLRWSYNTGTTTTGIDVDLNGNVFVAGERDLVNHRNVWKLSNTGSYLGSYDTTVDLGTKSVAVNNEGDIYVVGYRDVGNQRTVWKLDGLTISNLLWSYDTGNTTCTVIVDTMDNVYVGGESEISIDPNLPNVWAFDSSHNIFWSYGVGYTVIGMAIGE